MRRWKAKKRKGGGGGGGGGNGGGERPMLVETITTRDSRAFNGLPVIGPCEDGKKPATRAQGRKNQLLKAAA